MYWPHDCRLFVAYICLTLYTLNAFCDLRKFYFSTAKGEQRVLSIDTDSGDFRLTSTSDNHLLPNQPLSAWASTDLYGRAYLHMCFLDRYSHPRYRLLRVDRQEYIYSPSRNCEAPLFAPDISVFFGREVEFSP